ncbi:MAG: FecR domain-containing protein, partial [Brachymonas sp.]
QWNALARLNGLKNPNVILPGQVLDVPRSMVNFANQPKLAIGGTLQSANGTVTINGTPAQAGAAIAEGAQVQTATGSSAVVKLSDGSTVQLMPRSLAQVVSSHGYAMKDPASSISTTWFSGAIRLVEGVIDVAANKLAQRKEPMGVTTPTSNVGIRGTQFRVAYEDPVARTARTEVLEGRVRADNPAQAVGADVAGGFGVAIKPNEREVKVVALLPAMPESALPARVERAREGGAAPWAVGPLAGAESYRAELAQDSAFTQIVFDTKSTSRSINLAAAPDGNYSARVRGVDASGIEGYNAVRQIQIAAAPVSLIWIREINVAATADFLPEGLMLRANITASDTPRALQIQIAQDAAMSQGLQSLPLDASGHVLLKDIKAGERRFVRFVGSTAQGVAGSSPVMLLELPANWGSTVFGMTSALQPLR